MSSIFPPSSIITQSQRNDLRGQARESIPDEHLRTPPQLNINTDRPVAFAPLNGDLCTVRHSEHRPVFPPSATRPLRTLQRLRELVVLEINSWMVPCSAMKDVSCPEVKAVASLLGDRV